MKFTSRNATAIFYSLMLFGIAVADGLSGIYFNLWIFYVIPVGLATWNLGPKMGCRTYALMRASNSVSWRIYLWSNSPADENTDPPADSQMHLADVHGIFDE